MKDLLYDLIQSSQVNDWLICKYLPAQVFDSAQALLLQSFVPLDQRVLKVLSIEVVQELHL